MSVQKYRANPLAKNFYLLGAVRVLYSADHRVRHDEVDERQAVAQALAVVCRDILFGDDNRLARRILGPHILCVWWHRGAFGLTI
jgi:hypothetical protein